MYNLFFELLQVAIGTREALSHVPSAEEWDFLFNTANKQKLQGVCFVGLQKLGSEGNKTRANDNSSSAYTVNLPHRLFIVWLSYAAKIAQSNKEVTAACNDLVEILSHDGFNACVLKGQSNLAYYPEHLKAYRASGDIDLWVRTRGAKQNNKAVIEYVKQICGEKGEPQPKVIFYHVDYPKFRNIEVEIHFRPIICPSPLHCYRFLKWSRKVTAPTVEFNAVYQLLHINIHLFNEGIGLRQMMDYYFVLISLNKKVEYDYKNIESADYRTGIMQLLSDFGMKKLTSAVMWTLAYAFDPETSPNTKTDWRQRWPWMLCEPNEKEGRFLLNEIMQAGNFGVFDERIKRNYTFKIGRKRYSMPHFFVHGIEKTRHNLRLLTHYPLNVLWEPVFRVYHLLWRSLKLWKLGF